ncbi:hypothetical protein FLAVO9AF_190056 [Flavobacterium sp. 9AF]|nr:hypothetical protein FLAVO9AF_190056 [Flavobacterium sp. 9AF]
MGMPLNKKSFEEKRVNYVIIQSLIWCLIVLVAYNLFLYN